MDQSMKIELHEASVNFMFNVGATGQLANPNMFSAFVAAISRTLPHCSPEEIACCNAVMGQMAALRFSGTADDAAKRHFKNSMADVENFTFTKGVNVLTAVFQDVLGEGFLAKVIPDFATDPDEPEIRAAMREIGANNLADACDVLALKP